MYLQVTHNRVRRFDAVGGNNEKGYGVYKSKHHTDLLGNTFVSAKVGEANKLTFN